MRIAFALLAALVSSTAHAQSTVKVRAGEHADFSRIVIPTTDQQWSVSTAGRDIEITFANSGTEYDLSDLTGKRKAHRVVTAKIASSDDGRVLALTLACDCRVLTSQNASNAIVVDIRDAAPETANVAVDGQSASTPEEEETASRPDVAGAPLGQSIVATYPTDDPDQGDQNPEQPASAGETEQSATSENLAAARDRMIALLADARARGFVQIKDDGKDNLLADAAAELAEREKKDRLAQEAADALVVCVDPARFADVPLEQRDYETIIALRQKRDDTEGEKRLAASRDLAAAYLRIGFFDEANAVATSIEDKNDGELKLYAALAELAGAGPADAVNIFRHHASCGPAYEMLFAAAQAVHGAEYVSSLSDKQIFALNGMMRSMRGPLAEHLALNAIDHDKSENLTRLYQIASRARAPELTPALSVIEAGIANLSAQTIVDDEPLLNIAQTPGPMQTRALGELAKQYENDASVAYEGFLEDLLGQTSGKAKSLGDARASISGAKALADAGRIVKSIDLLAKASKVSDPARNAARALAQSILVDALAGEDEASRFLALNAYLKHKDFIVSENGRDDELILSVAREVASLGFADLTDEIVSASSHKRIRPETNIVKALAYLNSGDDESALSLIEKQRGSAEATSIVTRAAERLGDKQATVKAVRLALRNGDITSDSAGAAWRAGEWKLAAEAYAQLASQEEGDGERLALAAFMAGEKSMPDAATRALINDPDALERSTHLFSTAPYFTPGNLEEVVKYANGVDSETNRIRERLNDD